MAERKTHSVKSDIIVGVGGLALALGASFSEIRDELSDPDSSKSCEIFLENPALTCSLSVGKECKLDLIENALNPQYQGWFEIPSSCRGVDVKVVAFVE